MTYAEALELRSELESALSSGAGVASVSMGDRTITYKSADGMRQALAQINRDIAAYQRRASNANPSVSRARWR